MSTIQVTPDLLMHYEVDDFAPPWTRHEAVLLLHGNAESGEVWYGWMPHLTPEFRVVRPDMRGFGCSTAMPADYPWSADRIVDDFVDLMDALRIDEFHVVGAKVGGSFAIHLAARHPARVKTLTVMSPPIRPGDSADRYLSWADQVRESGVETWARSTMTNRLGASFPPSGNEWWIQLMGRTARSTQIGFLSAVPKMDLTPDLPRIQCPTLVIASPGNALYPLEQVQSWQRQIRRSRLVTIPGDSYHLAATAPQECAEAFLQFVSHSANS